jgi:septal ring factor EnvC (AmiA/AmiB activator)
MAFNDSKSLDEQGYMLKQLEHCIQLTFNARELTKKQLKVATDAMAIASKELEENSKRRDELESQIATIDVTVASIQKKRNELLAQLTALGDISELGAYSEGNNPDGIYL